MQIETQTETVQQELVTQFKSHIKVCHGFQYAGQAGSIEVWLTEKGQVWISTQGVGVWIRSNKTDIIFNGTDAFGNSESSSKILNLAYVFLSSL